jgi:hypothetical protein
MLNNNLSKDLRAFNDHIDSYRVRNFEYFINVFRSLVDEEVSVVKLARAYESVLYVYSDHVFDHYSYKHISKILYNYLRIYQPALTDTDETKPLMFDDLNLRKLLLDKISGILYDYFSNNKDKLVEFIKYGGCYDYVVDSGVIELLRNYEFENVEARNNFINSLEGQFIMDSTNKIPDSVFDCYKMYRNRSKCDFTPICMGPGTNGVPMEPTSAPGEDVPKYNLAVERAHDNIITFNFPMF